MLDTVITRAFGVAKRVRTETDIGVSAVSVSYAAVELAREIFGSLEAAASDADRRGQDVGACGAPSRRDRAFSRSCVTNRTEARAKGLASLVRGTIVPYEQYRNRLKEVDIVITSSGAGEYLLRKDEMKKIIDSRRNRPMFLIDIAVPRNIEPAVNELDNVFLYDIDDLQRVVDENLKGRMDQAAEADKIVAEEVERLEAWMRTRQVGPVIVSLQEHLEQIRQAEIDRVAASLGR